MRRIGSLYLATPDGGFPGSDERQTRRTLIAEGRGFTLRTPATPPATGEPDELAARALYADRVSLMRQVDGGIVNLTPFRGPEASSQTAFEMGFLAGLGKPLMAWMNLSDELEAEYRERIESWLGARQDETGAWRDGDDCLIEDFGLPEGHMLWCEARRMFLIVTDDPLDDQTGFEMCLDAMKLYAE